MVVERGAEARAAVAAVVIDALRDGDEPRAVREIVRAWGAEILLFLRTLARDAELADEAFAMFCEDLVRGIATYRGDGRRMFAWCHVVARHALVHAVRRERRHSSRRGGGDSVIGDLAEQTLQSVASYLQTRAQTALARLRAELDPEDDALLVLRVDDDLSWKDVAVALGEAPTVANVARIRKRYERIKSALRERLAREADEGDGR